jgi:hypothetical protein
MKKIVILFFAMAFAVYPLCAQTVVSDSADVPGLFHTMLERLSGTWETKGQLWLDAPDAKPVTAKGESRWRMTLDGYCLRMEDSLANKFVSLQSVALLAFNSSQHRYEMARADGKTTALNFFTGTADSALTLLTLDSPLSADSSRHERIVMRIINGNHFVWETWDVLENGTQIKRREITYKRLH